MTDFLLHLGWLTLSMSCVILIILLFQRIFGSRFSARSRYITWAVVILSLCVGVGLFRLPALLTFEVQMPDFTEEVNIEANGNTATTDAQTSAENPPTVATPSVGTTTPNTNTAPSQSAPIAPDNADEISVETQTNTGLDIDMPRVIFSIWTIGTVVYFAVNFALYICVTLKYARNKRVCNAKTEKLFRTMFRRYKIKRIPDLYVCADVGSPVLYGYLKPTILLPDMQFSENSLVGALAHELTHYRRGDIWIKLLCLVTESLHWFNPLVHLAAARCNAEMELSCDETVLSGMSENVRHSYGKVMLDIVAHCSHRRSLLTTQFNPHKTAVKVRIMNILDTTRKKHGGVLITAVLILCVFVSTIVACAQITPKQPTVISDEELKAEFINSFIKAEEAYAYFTGYGIPERANETMEIDGNTYEKVIQEGLSSLSELRESCLNYFTDEFTDELLSRKVAENAPLYIEKDGSLWRFGGYTALWDYAAYSVDTEYSLSKRNGNAAEFSVLCKWNDPLGDGEEIIEASITYNVIIENGTLRFTDFTLPVEVLWEKHTNYANLKTYMHVLVRYLHEPFTAGEAQYPDSIMGLVYEYCFYHKDVLDGVTIDEENFNVIIDGRLFRAVATSLLGDEFKISGRSLVGGHYSESDDQYTTSYAKDYWGGDHYDIEWGSDINIEEKDNKIYATAMVGVNNEVYGYVVPYRLLTYTFDIVELHGNTYYQLKEIIATSTVLPNENIRIAYLRGEISAQEIFMASDIPHISANLVELFRHYTEQPNTKFGSLDYEPAPDDAIFGDPFTLDNCEIMSYDANAQSSVMLRYTIGDYYLYVGFTPFDIYVSGLDELAEVQWHLNLAYFVPVSAGIVEPYAQFDTISVYIQDNERKKTLKAVDHATDYSIYPTQFLHSLDQIEKLSISYNGKDKVALQYDNERFVVLDFSGKLYYNQDHLVMTPYLSYLPNESNEYLTKKLCWIDGETLEGETEKGTFQFTMTDYLTIVHLHDGTSQIVERAGPIKYME